MAAAQDTNAPTPQQFARTIQRVRAILFLVLILSLAGATTELLLISHFEEWTQLIPLAVMPLAAVGVGWLGISRTAGAVWAVRLIMFIMAGAGASGVLLHFWANNEFQIELDPSINRWDLFYKSIRATAPPAFAPGVMIQLALVGWAYTLGPRASRKKPFHTGDTL